EMNVKARIEIICEPPLSISASSIYEPRINVCSLTALLPLHELLKQRLALGGIVASREPCLDQELLELSALRFRRLSVAGEPIVGGLEALPSRNGQTDVGFLPFRMARRLPKFVKLGEERVYEAGDPVVALRVLRPVVTHQQNAGGDGVDRL